MVRKAKPKDRIELVQLWLRAATNESIRMLQSEARAALTSLALEADKYGAKYVELMEDDQGDWFYATGNLWFADVGAVQAMDEFDEVGAASHIYNERHDVWGPFIEQYLHTGLWLLDVKAVLDQEWGPQ